MNVSYAAAAGSRFKARSRGFTLVEIMVVVIIIGMLAAMAIPAWFRVTASMQASRLGNDYRLYRDAFETYIMENGLWPADVLPGIVPPGMDPYLTGGFTETTHVGGNWDWDYQSVGVEAAISLINSTVQASVFEEVDAKMDDGNLGTGIFRDTGGRYSLVLEE